jgi:hypothetical protein
MRFVMAALLYIMLHGALLADSLKSGGKSYSGMFTGYEKGQLSFQEWSAAEAMKLDVRQVERLKIAMPTALNYSLSSAPKKVLTAPFLGLKDGAFLFVDGDGEKSIQPRQLARIEALIDYRVFMEEAQRAAHAKAEENGKSSGLRAADMLVPRRVTIVHFHHDALPASVRQGNLVQRLCENSRMKAAYVKVPIADQDDPVAKANKVRSLPQFWFYDRRGELSGKLTERFTEEDISKAYEAACRSR